MKKQPLIGKDGEVRELTRKDFARARPASDVFPELVEQVKKSRGRPRAETTRESITIRLSPEVTDYFRSTGKGWQGRVNEVLQEYVRKQH